MERAPPSMTPVADAGPAPIARPGRALYLVLSATALGAFALRTIQAFELNAAMGSTLSPLTVVVLQGAYWVAWSLWALALVPVVERLVERRPPATLGIAEAALLILVPVFAVPALALPVHKLLLPAGQGWPATYSHLLGHNIPTNLLLGVSLVAVAWGYLTVSRTRRLETTAARLHGQLAEAQLETLRAQLNPHFLFNALNSIAVLARRGQGESVEKMVTGLAGLLRHSLESSREQLVTLGVELTALRQYLEIEQVRYGARLHVDLDVPEGLHQRIVPSFLLQPLTENAIRHGFVDSDTVLHLAIRGEPAPDGLVLTVMDDGAGLDRDDGSRDGLGLGNTRARLAGLYGDRASLSLTSGPGGRGARVTVTIPASRGAAA